MTDSQLGSNKLFLDDIAPLADIGAKLNQWQEWAIEVVNPLSLCPDALVTDS